MDLYDFDTLMFPINWQMIKRDAWGTKAIAEANKRDMGVLAINGLAHRSWQEDEKKDSRYQKSWCKPIDVENTTLGVSALKFSIQAGADVIIPSGDFRNFSFCVDHIEEILTKPLPRKEKSILDNEFLAVKDYPFFNPRT